MATTILEADTTVESNVSTEEVKTSPEKEVVTETQEVSEQPTQEETPVATQEEPTFELDGEKLTATQIRKLKEDYENDTRWQAKNRRESEEINNRKRELGPLELIKPYLEQRPDILQEILKPKPTRDFDKELRDHYDARENLPRTADGSNYDYRAYTAWELEKDRLTTERASTLSLEAAQKQLHQADVRDYSNNLEQKWNKEYVTSGKLNQEEFLRSLQWIVQNVNARNGKIPEDAMRIAYRELFEEKYLREVKLEATKKSIAPILKAKQSVADGKTKQDVVRTDTDEADDSFVKAVRTRTRDYQHLS